MSPAEPPVATLQVSAWLPLLREALACDGQFRFPLRGASMRPTLPDVCEIVIVPLTARPPLGSLIVFAARDALIAHRLVAYTNTHWIAQGDGRWTPDGPLQPGQVLGQVAAAYECGRVIWPGRLNSAAAPFWVARYWLLRPARAFVRLLRRWGR